MKTALARATLLSLVLFVAVPVRAEEPSLLHSAPARAQAGLPLKLDGTLVDGARILEMFVRYRGPGEPYARVQMERQYGDLYRGIIPAEHMAAPGVEYYVEGVTADGERVAIFQTAARPARVLVAGDSPASTSTASRPTTGPESRPSISADTDERPPARLPMPPPPSDKPKAGTASSRPPPPAASSDDSMAALTAELPEEAPPAPKTPARATPPPRESTSTPTREPTASPRASTSGREVASSTREGGTGGRESASSGRGAGASHDSPSHREPPAGSSRDAFAPMDAEPGRSALEDDLALYSAEDTLALATRHEEKVQKVPAIGASFNRDQISALGARTVADVLDVVPGLTVSRDVQGFHRTAIRGLRNDAEVLFLLNGHRLNNFFDGKALMNLPVENLERIEVIRGPGSALYGAGAFLGVVNIVTDTSDGLRTAVSAGGFPEKDDRLAVTVNGHVSAGQTFGDLRLFADVDLWSQKGDSNIITHDSLDDEAISQGLRAVEDPAGRTQDDRFLLNLGGGATYAMGDAGKLGASVRFLTENRTALLGLFDAVAEDSELKWNVLMADLSWEKNVGASVLLRARAGFDQQSTDRRFQLTPSGFRTGSDANQLFENGMQEQSRVSVRTLTGGLDADVALAPTNRLSLGVVVEQQSLGDYEYETNYTLDTRVRPGGFARPEGLADLLELADGAASRRLSVGLFAQDQWTVVDALTLTFGVRLDATQLPEVDGSGTITGTSFVSRINPRVGLVFSATDSLVLKALYGRAFRAPTLQELAERIPDTDYSQGRFEGNPRLQPATVDTFELGADLIQSAGDARVRLRANAFLELFSSPIVPVDTSGNIVPLRNRELGVRVYGVEGEARLEASKRASAWFNASISRAQDMELPPQSRLLTDTPQARFNAGVSMPIGAWVNFDLVVRAGAERRNNSRSVLELIRRYKIPAYSLITAQIRSEPILDIWEVSLVAHNVFDHDMRDDVPRPDRVTDNLPREGMSGYLTVRAHF
ncbi:TonB-dependent receptor [Myxococcus sp. K15C18031901]|uniref:TonB-dependent receptor plug domain-containing protein n=1 Tax=Myxococcus dinghuensis TaxID=2906761 RepID=UPI0020A7E54A|nr:TonB-dependent receptor [Myxococcus dinghuensis]MCP3103503.1 TonB-dependent receptor [Myxococcus dinghuensis]